jgi:hypothetical protein
MADGVCTVSFVCMQCGKAAQRPYRGSGVRPTLCGNSCKTARWKDRNPETAAKGRARQLAAKKAERMAAPKPVQQFKQCSCGRETISASVVRCGQCNRELANTKALAKAVQRHQGKTCKCIECNAVFQPAYGSKRRSYCSAECALKGNRKHSARGNDRKRARAHGVEYQYINPMKVLRRDNWTCQLCGRKTPEAFRGTLHDRAPEVDHILPISKGGAHTYANLQCACRACNAAKGDTPMGQLKLFAA